MKQRFFLLLLFGCSLNAVAQWTPIVKNYMTTDYHAGTQNWGIAEQENGWIYIANNYGLLEYDGCYWNLYGLPNSTPVRSVTVGDDHRVYVGGRNQYGYFEPNSIGEMVYTSLSDSIPSVYQHFNEVWHIISDQGNLYVHTRQLLICHIDSQIHIIDPGSTIEAIAMVNHCLYVATGRDIYMLVEKRLHTLNGANLLKGASVSKMIEMDDNLLIATDCNGLFIYDGETIHPFPTEADSDLHRYQIYTMALYKDYIILGTVRQGLIVISKTGKKVLHLTRKKGLQNNTVLSLHVNQNHYLWVGLDNGLDKILISENVSFLHDETIDYGSGYTYRYHEGYYYLGTNHGLFYQSSPDSPLQFVDGSQGQVWALDQVGKDLFCSHNKGLYHVHNHHLTQLLSNGCWHVKEINATEAIVGTYDGFYYIVYERNKWQAHPLSGFSETAFYFSYESATNSILVSTTDKKMVRLELDKEHFRLISKAIDVNAYKIDKERNIVPKTKVDSSGFPWKYLDEGHLLIDGFYQSYTTPDSCIVVGGIDGFYRFNTRTIPSVPQQLFIRRVAITSPYKQQIYGEGYHTKHSPIVLPSGTYSLNIQFSGSNITAVSPRFATRLWPIEKDYGAFTEVASRDFIGLNSGQYRLDIQMLDGLSGNMVTRHIDITIQKPYYLQWWAFGIYATLLILIIIYSILRIRQYTRKKTERIQQEKDQELQQQQMHILQLEKEQTQNKLKNKSQELSHILLNEVNRKEWTQSVLTELRRIIDLIQSNNFSEAKTRIQALQTQLTRNVQSGLDWKRFETNFDLVHENFIARLKEQFPWMSKQEQQLCIYIKMGLLSKEIAPLMNISIRGVEMLRYRMRQKMQLPESSNIKKVLKQLSSPLDTNNTNAFLPKTE